MNRAQSDLKAAVLTSSVSRAGGGVYESARRLTQVAAERESVRFDVLGLSDRFTNEDFVEWRPLQPQTFSVRGPRAYGYSPALATALDDADADLAHVHGLWTFPTLAASRWSRRHKRPYLVTIHGMMDPWALNHSRLKKRLVLAFFEERVLRGASCLHVLNEPELESVRALGYGNPACVIPNGVDLPDDEAGALRPVWHSAAEGRKVLLYLGRIHPKKGLVNLIEALAIIRRDHPSLLGEWAVVIAGWDQDGHEAELKDLAAQRGLGGAVIFAGPQFGAAKRATFRSADAFVLPSLSEGLPMAVLEAWAYRLPVIMTPECNLDAGFRTGSALRVGPGAASVAEGLQVLFELSKTARRDMGRRGRALVEAGYSWASVASQMRSVYDWMAGGGDAPPCVRLGI